MKKIFILFFYLISFVSFAQNPGGIQGVTTELWLKADELGVNVKDGEDIKDWKDKSNKGRHFSAPLEYRPRFIESSMNYNPAVEFYYQEKDEDEGIEGVTKLNNERRKLVSNNSFIVNGNTSYFVIWVSRVDKENSNANATVLKLGGSKETNNFGWSKSGALWDEIGSTKTVHNYSESDYGIGMSIIPNIKAGGVHNLYFNGLKSGAREAAKTLNTAVNLAVIGNSGGASVSTNAFFGEVYEIIVLSRPAGANGVSLTPLEMNKINTYLAIKYGISLDKYGGQRSYTLSDGTDVYNIDSNGYVAYNKDVFGIARDNGSGLHQKQSVSSEKPYMTVYLGDFADTNAENNSVLTDKYALMFGGNGLEGTSSYKYDVGTKFANYTLTSVIEGGVETKDRISTIYNYKYRAKTTGKTAFTVNLAPNLGEWLLISKDEKFSPATTRIYKINGGKVEGVEIMDGDYIGFALYAKAPGGVFSGLKMWLNASIPNTVSVNSDGEILNWRDYAGLGTSYRRRAANKASAKYVKYDEKTNFHPTLKFEKKEDYLITDKAPFSVAVPSNVAFYTVVNHSFATTRSYFIGFGDHIINTKARRPAFGVYRDKAAGKGRIGSTGLTNSKQRLFTPMSTTIAGYHWNVGSTITFEFDAHSESVKHTYKTVLMNEKGMLGLGSSSSNYFLDGVMPEVIAYEGVLTQDERNRINSYLGLKYGITIDLNKESPLVNFDYLFSDGKSIWKGNDKIHNMYHNNVTSVLRDDDASLYNRQSKSTEVGSALHMGVGTKLGIDPILGDINKDKSAITWGHNNQPMSTYSFAGNQEICGAMDSRLNGRVWLVDNVNFDQEIMVSAYGPEFPFNGANYQVFLLVADSAEKLTANKWDQVVPMAFVDGKHIVNYKFRDKFTYITFGAKVVGTCDNCEFPGIKSIDFTKSNWKRGDKAKSFNLGDNFNVNITVEDLGGGLKKKYPRASSKKSLKERIASNKMVTTKIAFTKDNKQKAAAATSFELFDVDRTGRVLDVVQVIGYCNGSPVYPKLSYTYNKAAKSRYTIDNVGTAKAKKTGVPGNGNSGYTNKKGRVFVDFEHPVEEIHVIYKTEVGKGAAYIGIGPMEFYCVAPLPPPNEDGLILTKQGPAEAKLCDIIDYTFRSVNTNCASKEVLFTDTLPEGMVWVNDSFSAGGIDIEDEQIYGYGTRTLVVSGLMIPGGGSTYTFRASAIFDENAKPGIYKNRAALDYDRNGKKVELLSQDRLTGNDFTETDVKDSPRPKQIITSFTSDKSCFSLSKEIEFTIEIDNPNDVKIEEMFLGIDYDNVSFKLVSGSLQTSKGLNLGSNQGEEGSLEFEDFTLPSGKSWIKYKVKASDNLADYDIDSTTKDPADVNFSYELISESEDDCLASSLVNANGEIDLPFCTICYYKPVTGSSGDIFASEGFMALTTLKRMNNAWMSQRGNAFVVLESKDKGLVITRLTTDQIMKLEAKEGMLVYDTTVNCVKLYNGKAWGCVEQGCVDE
ncbi:hypothetical protein [Myroides phaeus]|uniref:Conserved repeat domain-containing protein n=1 Tax=Myroides phaeus TaxID=702745 RepID=A0A1G8GGM9_9FLAO|nr:hypothetical protein [Myroides phaeus]SDH93437.1 conserved repeat domain-containing protein [Myroides phaeus]